MKKFAYAAILALTAGLFIAPAMATSHEGEGDVKISIHGDIRVRWEYLSNLTDFRDHDNSGDSLDDDFDIWPYRVRMGVKGAFSRDVYGYMEIQNHGLFGNDFIPGYGSPGDPLLQAFRTDYLSSETSLYQGFLKIKNLWDTNWHLKIGRQEHTIGNELMLGDLDFYNGISFDGIRVMYRPEKWGLDLFMYQLQENNLSINALGADNFPNGGDEDIWLAGVNGSYNFEGNAGVLVPYLIYTRNGNGFFDADGDPSSLIGLADQHTLFTFGFLYQRLADEIEDVEDLNWDWSAELAAQSGDYDPNSRGFACPDCDLGGMIFEGWIGYNIPHEGSDAWSRIWLGALYASGDDDSTDSDIDAFVPLFPDSHANNRLGDLDLFAELGINTLSLFGSPGFGMSNITDINVGYSLHLNDGMHEFMVGLHNLTLSEEETFTIGPVTFKEDEIGNELDLRYKYQYSPQMAFEVGFATLFAGDYVDALVAEEFGLLTEDADDLMRLYGMARLRF
jgi:hypothetical protein